MGLAKVLVCALMAVPMGLAHPHGVEEKIYANAALPLDRRSLDHCKHVLEEPEFVKRTIARREAEVKRLMQKRGIEV